MRARLASVLLGLAKRRNALKPLSCLFGRLLTWLPAWLLESDRCGAASAAHWPANIDDDDDGHCHAERAFKVEKYD